MGKITYGMLVSLDGYIASSTKGTTLPIPQEALHSWFNRQQRQTRLSLYGRRMYEVMRYWGEPDPDRPSWGDAFADAWVETPKVVVSTTLTEVGPNATLLNTDIEAALRRLKQETDGTIEVSGAELAASLGRWGLIDEYSLFVQPTVFGGGKPYFAAGFRPDLQLIGTEDLPQQVVRMRYAPVTK